MHTFLTRLIGLEPECLEALEAIRHFKGYSYEQLAAEIEAQSPTPSPDLTEMARAYLLAFYQQQLPIGLMDETAAYGDELLFKALDAVRKIGRKN